MKLFSLFRKAEKTEKIGRFSDFFLNVPKERKERVLREVAEKANQEQREMFMKARLKMKTG